MTKYNAEYQKAWRDKNREKIRAKNRVYAKLWYNNPQNKAKRKEYAKKWRTENKEYYVKYLKEYFKNPNAKLKRQVRQKTKDAIRKGLLKMQNCFITGCKRKAEAHHQDYNKPFEITWLCKLHHGDLHRILRSV